MGELDGGFCGFGRIIGIGGCKERVEAKEVNVFGESGWALWVRVFDELGTSWAANGVGEGFGELCEAGFVGGLPAGENLRAQVLSFEL